ncbi:MAG: ATP-binding cassette domain-containing protein [Paludibacteraceae bacterium]|nr:ATP-binding cassette domain-containing protein [Paludibacteraceae bacterium]
MENIFEIQNLKCSYKKTGDPSDLVLEIDSLQIPKGKVVFFVGPSGVGKSTILETLGFMNKTIVSVDTFNYCGQDVKNVWEWDDNKISDFRNSEFSFVFQQCNLMDNFTAYENVMATALIQGMNWNEARKKTHHVLELMKLPANEDRPIYEYSGGQRQRLAFARAILPTFNVIFGDEPTGNLDPKTAENLMELLTAVVRKENVSAIIVSHDMHLAVDYADLIVQIQRVAIEEKEGKLQEERYKGVINASSFYEKLENQQWLHCGHEYTKNDLLIKLMEEMR